jgi:hypothetical protein
LFDKQPGTTHFFVEVVTPGMVTSFAGQVAAEQSGPLLSGVPLLLPSPVFKNRLQTGLLLLQSRYGFAMGV